MGLIHAVPQQPPLTPQLLLRAYSVGIFPMSEARDDPEVFWVDPEQRGVIPLNNLHISRSLRREIRRQPFDVRINSDFEGVVRGCADRPETWINDTIFDLYMHLHRAGHAHCQEVWDGPDLVGGIYGVTVGSAFFGESMFSRRTNASKIAMVYLVDRLRHGGFTLFDTQFLTEHLASLGGREIPREHYHEMLDKALDQKADFTRVRGAPPPQEILQRSTQTS